MESGLLCWRRYRDLSLVWAMALVHRCDVLFLLLHVATVICHCGGLDKQYATGNKLMHWRISAATVYAASRQVLSSKGKTIDQNPSQRQPTAALRLTKLSAIGHRRDGSVAAAAYCCCCLPVDSCYYHTYSVVFSCRCNSISNYRIIYHK